MKNFLILTLLILSTTAFAIDFVIPEINTKFDALDTSITNIETIADGKILMGNGSNVGTEVTPSGDITMTNAGVNAIAAGVITEADNITATTTGLQIMRIAAATWDFATDGGATETPINMGVTIPANSLINFCYFYTVTQVVDSGSGTGALHCEDANNLFAAADVTGNADGSVILGIPQNGAANMVKAIASDCNLTWTIATAPATAGKLNFYCQYTAHD